jgi:hypothetical protein
MSNADIRKVAHGMFRAPEEVLLKVRNAPL